MTTEPQAIPAAVREVIDRMRVYRDRPLAEWVELAVTNSASCLSAYRVLQRAPADEKPSRARGTRMTLLGTAVAALSAVEAIDAEHGTAMDRLDKAGRRGWQR